MATLYSNQASNVSKTWLLMMTFLLIIIVIGFVLAYVYDNAILLYIAVIISVLLNISAYWFSDSVVLIHGKRHTS
jgi:hypothetical protein